MPNEPWPCIECRVMMQQIDEDHCKCPICGTEVWYSYQESEDPDEIADLMQETYNSHQKQPDFSVLGGKAQPGGGSKSGKSNRKQLLKKPSTTQLYKKLVDG